ncbi:MAG TPA: diguanylate cyclase [Methyloversatilis sp.]
MDLEERSLELLQKLNVGIVIHAPDARVVFSNRRASELLGFTEDELKGRISPEPERHFVDEHGERLAPPGYPASRVIATGMPVTDQVMGIGQPGEPAIVWVWVNAFPEFDDAGRLRQVIVNFHDISRRKRAEQTLQEKATQLEFVLGGAELGFWDWNIVTGEVTRNERWATMLGYSHDEIQRTTMQWSDFVHPDDREGAWDSIYAVLEGRSPAHKLEYRMLHKDGGIRWILDQANVMTRDADGVATRMCGIHADITDRKLLEEALTRQAQIDYLTGVFNRRHFMERAELELSRAIRYGGDLAILMMDIDFFKQINDRYGHKVGDNVLKKLAEVCCVTLRTVDIFGRLGGEEFAILLPQTDRAGAALVAERLRESIAQAKVPLEGGLPATFTVSIGVTSISSKDDNIDVLLNIADAALYDAKNSGRNKVCVAAG